MQREHITTWAPSTWFRVDRPRDEGEWGTQLLTLGCPADFFAVRVGFVNVLPTPFKIRQLIVSASAGWGDLVNPVGKADWKVLMQTASGGLEASPATVSPEIEVGGASALTPSSHHWTWTDWLPLNNADPDPDTRMRVVMLRYVLARQAVTYVAGQFREWSHSIGLTKGFRYFIGGYNNGRDAVLHPDPLDCHTARLNSLFNGSLIAAVQFKTYQKSVVGFVVGDSHFEGTSTTSQFMNAVAQLTLRRGRQRAGDLAYGYINAARGGASSELFLPRAITMLDEFQPDYVVLPSWSFYDVGIGVDPMEATERYFTHLRQVLAIAEQRRILPILVSPIPRDRPSMNERRVAGWLSAHDFGRAIAQGETVFVDISGVFSEAENGRLLGVWPSTSPFTNDGVHPNDLGHGVLAHCIERYVTRAFEE